MDLSLVDRLFAEHRARCAAHLARMPVIPGVIRSLTNGYNVVNPRVTDIRFPTITQPSLQGAQLEDYGAELCSEVALLDLRSRGRRGGRAAETVLYGVMNPEQQRRYWLIGIGQVTLDSNPDERDDMIVLTGGDRSRTVQIASIWRSWKDTPPCRILSFPMTPEELAARDAEDAHRRGRFC